MFPRAWQPMYIHMFPRCWKHVYIYIYIYMAVSHFFRDWQGKEDGPGGTQCPPRPARVFFGPPVFSYVLGVAWCSHHIFLTGPSLPLHVNCFYGRSYCICFYQVHQSSFVFRAQSFWIFWQVHLPSFVACHLPYCLTEFHYVWVWSWILWTVVMHILREHHGAQVHHEISWGITMTQRGAPSGEDDDDDMMVHSEPSWWVIMVLHGDSYRSHIKAPYVHILLLGRCNWLN